MNGPPVCPGEKTENAPTWRPRKHFFGVHFLPIFLDFCPPTPHYFPHLNPNTHANPHSISDINNHQCKVQTLALLQLKLPFINTTQRRHKRNQVY